MYGIFTYVWLILIVNVGKYISPMDKLGDVNIFIRPATAGTHRSARHVWPQVYWHNDGYTPRNWTWNTEKKQKRKFLLETIIFRFHVTFFRGVNYITWLGCIKSPVSIGVIHLHDLLSSLLCWLYGSEQKNNCLAIWGLEPDSFCIPARFSVPQCSTCL